MSDSEDQLPHRLDYVCRNAEKMRRRLEEKGAADWIAQLSDAGSETASVLARLEDELALRSHPGWGGGVIRGPMEVPPQLLGGFPGDVDRVLVQPHLECPRPVGDRCSRMMPWHSEKDEWWPRCALTGAALRWGGRLGWSDGDGVAR